MTMIRDGKGDVIDGNNPLPTLVSDSTIIQPVDIQSHYATTIQTHNAVVNPASAVGVWIPCDSFTEVSFHTTIAGTMRVDWSIDGTNALSSEAGATTVITTQSIKAPYVRMVLTATGTVSAYAYLKA